MRLMEPWEREDQARQRKRALNDLRLHWDDAYEITWDGSRFRAVRLDDGYVLADERPGRLRELLIADYSARAIRHATD